MRVGVIGLRWDITGEVVRALVDAGHEVVAVHQGSYDASEIPEPTMAALEGVLDRVEQVGFDTVIYDDLMASGWAAVEPVVGDCDVVVLGRWHGWVEEEYARQAIEWARDHDRRLIAVEAPSLAEDQTIRWLTRWAQEAGAEGSVAFIRRPPTEWEVPTLTGTPGTGVLLDVHRADLAATMLRGDYGMVLAGRLWERVGDALGGVAFARFRSTAGEVDFGVPDGLPAVVYASQRDDGVVDAMRFVGDADSFDQPQAPPPVATLRIPDGQLVVESDDETVSDTFDVAAGEYVVQISTDPFGMQLYRIPDSARPADDLRGGCPICGEESLPVAYGYPSSDMLEAADAGDIRLGGCVIGPGSLRPPRCSRCGTWLTQTRRGWEAQAWDTDQVMDDGWI